MIVTTASSFDVIASASCATGMDAGDTAIRPRRIHRLATMCTAETVSGATGYVSSDTRHPARSDLPQFYLGRRKLDQMLHDREQ